MANPDIKLFLIGNKNDLEDSRKVSRDTGKQFLIQNNLDFFCESSAKTGSNTQNIFLEACKKLYVQHLEYQNKSRASSITDPSISFKPLVLPTKDFGETEANEKKFCC